MEAKIYQLTNTEKEAHFPDGNQSVAVCWRIKPKNFNEESWIRQGHPYISFVSVYRGDDTCEDEDSRVEGGFSSLEALEIVRELFTANIYLDSLQTKK
jgi:hypothetical protein